MNNSNCFVLFLTGVRALVGGGKTTNQRAAANQAQTSVKIKTKHFELPIDLTH